MPASPYRSFPEVQLAHVAHEFLQHLARTFRDRRRSPGVWARHCARPSTPGYALCASRRGAAQRHVLAVVPDRASARSCASSGGPSWRRSARAVPSLSSGGSPKRVVASARAQSSSRETSASSGTMFWLRRASASTSPRSRAVKATTRAPARARPSAIARPSPRPAPLTIATLFASGSCMTGAPGMSWHFSPPGLAVFTTPLP